MYSCFVYFFLPFHNLHAFKWLSLNHLICLWQSQLSRWDWESSRKWACGYACGWLSWLASVRWKDLPTVGGIIPWARILDCMKKRKWTEYKHSLLRFLIMGSMWTVASSSRYLDIPATMDCILRLSHKNPFISKQQKSNEDNACLLITSKCTSSYPNKRLFLWFFLVL